MAAPSPAATPAPVASMQASTPSASSSRRWADYSDDEDDGLSPHSYREVLHSGTPFPSPVARGGAWPWSAALSLLAAGAGAAAPVGGVDGAAPSRVDSPSGGVDAPVVGLDGSVAEILAGGARQWTHVGGRKRPRGWQEELPAMQIRDDLPPNLAGVSFNCLLLADHISRNCTKETACLRCRKPGHHARDCHQGQASAGGSQSRRQQLVRACLARRRLMLLSCNGSCVVLR
jgi:hypothetical protein